MKAVPFWKMSGSGNDFVVIDNRRKSIRAGQSSLARKVCHRQFGVGADGLLLLEPDPNDDFRMVYYNADGSRADMCGNGARCMAWFAHAKHVVGSTFHFRTDAYSVGAKVQGNVVRVTLADAKGYRPEVTVKIDGKTFRPASLNTGVPHAVLFVPDADKAHVSDLGPKIRFHKAFGPKGTNVNFVQKIGPHKIRVRN
jgi:diaminopimelate epimerase